MQQLSGEAAAKDGGCGTPASTSSVLVNGGDPPSGPSASTANNTATATPVVSVSGKKVTGHTGGDEDAAVAV